MSGDYSSRLTQVSHARIPVTRRQSSVLLALHAPESPWIATTRRRQRDMGAELCATCLERYLFRYMHSSRDPDPAPMWRWRRGCGLPRPSLLRCAFSVLCPLCPLCSLGGSRCMVIASLRQEQRRLRVLNTALRDFARQVMEYPGLENIHVPRYPVSSGRASAVQVVLRMHSG